MESDKPHVENSEVVASSSGLGKSSSLRAKAQLKWEAAQRRKLLNSLFPRWDLDGSGYVDMEELQQVVNNMERFHSRSLKRTLAMWMGNLRGQGRSHFSRTEFVDLMEDLSVTFSSSLFNEFLAAIYHAIDQLEQLTFGRRRRVLYDLFNKWDNDGSGFIDFGELGLVVDATEALKTSKLLRKKSYKWKSRFKSDAKFEASAMKISLSDFHSFINELIGNLPDEQFFAAVDQISRRLDTVFDALKRFQQSGINHGSNTSFSARRASSVVPAVPDDLEVDDSATRIQAVYRGYTTRKQLHSELKKPETTIHTAYRATLGDKGISEPEVQRRTTIISSFFPRWDVDGSGYIDLNELQQVISTVDTRSDKFVRRALTKWMAHVRSLGGLGFDRNSITQLILELSCKMTPSQFEDLTLGISLALAKLEELTGGKRKRALWELFQKWDFNGNGRLEFAEIGLVVNTSEAFRRSKVMRKNAYKWHGAFQQLEVDGKSLTLAQFQSFMNELLAKCTDEEFYAALQQFHAKLDLLLRTAAQAKKFVFDRRHQSIGGDTFMLQEEHVPSPAEQKQIALIRQELADERKKKAEKRQKPKLAEDEATARKTLIRKLFPLWDLDGSGFVDFQELQQVIFSVDPANERQQKRVWAQWLAHVRGTGGSDRFYIEEFTHLLFALTTKMDAHQFEQFHMEVTQAIDRVCALTAGRRKKALWELFQRWDLNGDGSIDFAELEAVVAAGTALPKSKSIRKLCAKWKSAFRHNTGGENRLNLGQFQAFMGDIFQGMDDAEIGTAIQEFNQKLDLMKDPYFRSLGPVFARTPSFRPVVPVDLEQDEAATKIAALYRGHLVRRRSSLSVLLRHDDPDAESISVQLSSAYRAVSPKRYEKPLASNPPPHVPAPPPMPPPPPGAPRSALVPPPPRHPMPKALPDFKSAPGLEYAPSLFPAQGAFSTTNRERIRDGVTHDLLVEDNDPDLAAARSDIRHSLDGVSSADIAQFCGLNTHLDLAEHVCVAVCLLVGWDPNLTAVQPHHRHFSLVKRRLIEPPCSPVDDLRCLRPLSVPREIVESVLQLYTPDFQPARLLSVAKLLSVLCLWTRSTVVYILLKNKAWGLSVPETIPTVPSTPRLISRPPSVQFSPPPKFSRSEETPVPTHDHEAVPPTQQNTVAKSVSSPRPSTFSPSYVRMQQRDPNRGPVRPFPAAPVAPPAPPRLLRSTDAAPRRAPIEVPPKSTIQTGLAVKHLRRLDVSGAIITDEELRRQFDELDTNGNGWITKDEFRRLYAMLNNFDTDEPTDIDRELSRFNMVGSGRLSFAEFALLMLRLAQR